jgi:hypothetical protein
MRTAPLSAVAALVMAALAFPDGAPAQSTFASIVGTVRDRSGAVVPGATVTVTNTGTNQNRSAVTNDQGDYLVASLLPGEYGVAVEMAGFKKQVRGGIVLQVNQRARLDFALEVGQIADTVNVTGGAPLVESETAEVGKVVESRQVSDLPLNGRNYLQLATLVAGANGGAPGNRVSAASGSPSINGVRTEDVTYLLDGADNVDLQQGHPAVRPSVDALHEFKVLTSQYSAEFGRAAGGVISAAVKTGTNEFRGSAFEFLRNDVLDARNFFAARKSPFRMNQFGATLGGPILHDRTFFFVAYEGLRTRQFQVRSATVPTAAQRSGDFSAAGLRAIYNPFEVDAATGLRAALPGNRVPASRIHPTAGKLLAFWPDENRPGDPFNFVRQFSSSTDIDQAIVRVDHSFSERDQLFGRLSVDNNPIFVPGSITGPFGFDQQINGRQAAVVYTHIFGPRATNEFKFAYTRRRDSQRFENQGHNYAKDFGFSNADLILPEVFGFPGISVTGYTSLGGGNVFDTPTNTVSFDEKIALTRGSHFIKMGFTHWRYRMHSIDTAVGGSSFSFTGRFSGRGGGVGEPLADLLLGAPETIGGLSSNTVGEFAEAMSMYHGFVADDWKVGSRLTLNLGLRYELNLPPTSPGNRAVANFAWTTPGGGLIFPLDAPVPADFTYPHFFRNTHRLWDVDANNIAPRIGFAFRPFRGNATAIRGGYGFFYDVGTQNFVRNIGIGPPFYVSGSTAQDFTRAPVYLLGNVPVVPLNPSAGVGIGFKAVDDRLRTGYVQAWNLNVQQQLAGATALEIGYAGNKGTKLVTSRPLNQPRPGPGAVQPRRPFPLFTSCQCYFGDNATSYHALQVKVERRFARGLSFLSGYTWSKGISDGSETGGSGDGDAAWPQDEANRRAHKGLAPYDTRHRFTVSYVYELPIGRAGSAALRTALGGWQVGGIVALQSGFPYSVRYAVNSVNTGERTTIFPNLIGPDHGNLPESERTVQRFFNTGAFEAPAPYVYGTAGRNILIGDGIANVDFSILKRLALGEHRELQFRTELFNAFNHPTFGFPAASIGVATVGRVTTASTARQIQFGLKLRF